MSKVNTEAYRRLVGDKDTVSGGVLEGMARKAAQRRTEAESTDEQSSLVERLLSQYWRLEQRQERLCQKLQQESVRTDLAAVIGQLSEEKAAILTLINTALTNTAQQAEKEE